MRTTTIAKITQSPSASVHPLLGASSVSSSSDKSEGAAAKGEGEPHSPSGSGMASEARATLADRLIERFRRKPQTRAFRIITANDAAANVQYRYVDNRVTT